jgi:hypothetical protein
MTRLNNFWTPWTNFTLLTFFYMTCLAAIVIATCQCFLAWTTTRKGQLSAFATIHGLFNLVNAATFLYNFDAAILAGTFVTNLLALVDITIEQMVTGVPTQWYTSTASVLAGFATWTSSETAKMGI